jgi:hypothetical protein
MALPNLTDQNIQDTYQRVVTTEGGIYYDGTGSLLNLGSSDEAESIHIAAKNTSGDTITKGTPVYITGNVGNSEKLTIAAADASDPSKMPAVGLAESTLTNNAEGFIAQGGYLRQIATATIDGTSTTSNDTVYVKAGGGLTLTKPSGSALIQNIAKVARSHASAGSLIVSSILRTNDVPNLLEGQIFFGSGSNQMYQTHISSALDSTTLNNITISNTGSFGRVICTTISASTGQFDANTIIVGNTSFSEVEGELQFKSGDDFQQVKAKNINLVRTGSTATSVQISDDGQGFIAVNAEPGKFSTVFRAESTAVSGDTRMGSITQKGSGSFAILLDADAPGIRPDAKFVIESNAAVPNVGTRLFSVSESMEVRSYGSFKADTNITASGNISASGQLIGMIDGGTF